VRIFARAPFRLKTKQRNATAS